MKFFFSCDWGTSTFRLRLINGENGKVLSTIKTDYGIAVAFECWKAANQLEDNRLKFYQAYLFEQVKKITAVSNYSLEGTPVILSGMASSSIGMLELPYKEMPFLCNGADLKLHTLFNDHHPHKIILVSGAASALDVIRGEETLLAGCDVSDDNKHQLFIFPGTHSKHITVKNGAAQNITTYMTGELFDLLSKKSILAASVKKEDSNNSNPWFIEGVKKGITQNLLNAIFHVRTNQLFNKTTPGENYQYLSGLLIGAEVKNVAEYKPANITLVCGEELENAYLQAIDVVGLSKHLHFKNADYALVNGHCKIMQHLNL